LHFIEELLETIEENKIKSRLPYSPVAEARSYTSNVIIVDSHFFVGRIRIWF
jgi:hypothetical protein